MKHCVECLIHLLEHLMKQMILKFIKNSPLCITFSTLFSVFYQVMKTFTQFFQFAVCFHLGHGKPNTLIVELL